MQCQSYLPMYHLPRDHIVYANRGSQPMHDGNWTFRSAHYNNYVPSMPVPTGNFAYKELLRQTMLIHEDTFKNQVQELHRLYRRQRELMAETETTELFMNNLQLQIQSSEYPSTDLLSRCGQRNLQNFPFSNSQKKPCLMGADDFQRAFNCNKELNKPESLCASQNGITLDKYPKGKVVVAGKLLDLELPADVYIDGDEWESLGDAQYGEAPNSTSLPSNKQAKFVVETNDAASGAKIDLSPVLQKEFPASNSSQRTNSDLTDLNEPPTFQWEKSETLLENEKASEVSVKNVVPFWCRNAHLDGTPYKESLKQPLSLSGDMKRDMHIVSDKNSFCSLGTKPSIVQALPFVTNQSRPRKGAHRIGSIKPKSEARCNSSFDRSKSLQSTSSDSNLGLEAYFTHTKCFDLNSVSEFTPEDTSSGEAFNEEADKGNYPREHIVTAKLNGVNSFSSLDGEHTRKNKRCRVFDINLSRDAKGDLFGHNDKSFGQMNLNTCFTDYRSPIKPLSLDRKASEIDLEAPVSPEVEERPPPRGDSEELLSETTIQEGDDTLGKLAQIAAEVIVSISSKKSSFLLASKGLQDCEAIESGYLKWFADIAYSFSNGLGYDLGMSRYEDTSDFEALTSKLTELKVEVCCSRNFVDTSDLNSSVSVVDQTRQGRAKRSKRKNFQTKTRRTYKTLVKKPQATKRHMTPIHVPEVKDVFPRSWGKDNQRPRAQRTAASPSAIMSKWLHFSVLVGRPSQHLLT